MKKALVLILPIFFLAQSCNILTSGLTGKGGSGSRGVFVSTDNGQAWQESNALLAGGSISGADVNRLIVDRNDAKNLLAVTRNSGVYASNDSGAAWFQFLPNVSGYDAYLNPQNSREIVVAGASGARPVIVKSSDAGGAWTQVYSHPVAEAAVTAIVYDQRNTAILYAGLSTGTIIKSIDGGLNWNTLITHKDRVVRLLLSSNGGTLYMLGRALGLKKSSDGGRTWTDLKLPEKAAEHSDIAFENPANANVLYLASSVGLFKTTDGGGNWTKLSIPATPAVTQVSAVTVSAHNNSQVFAAVRSTIYRSDDGGASWRTQSLPTNRVISSIVIDPQEPSRVYAGLKEP